MARLYGHLPTTETKNCITVPTRVLFLAFTVTYFFHSCWHTVPVFAIGNKFQNFEVHMPDIFELECNCDICSSVARCHGTTAAPRYHFSTVPVPSPLPYFLVPQYHKYRGSSALYLSVVDTQ